MLGNVSEWCQDWYGDYLADPQTDPLGPTTGSVRTIRGGSIDDVRSFCRSSCRNHAGPSFGDTRMGFRVVLAPTQPNPGTPLRFILPGNLALDMLPIPAGTFTMGSSDSGLDRGSDESPQHLVSLDAFHMAKLECTQAQWLAVMGGANPAFFSIAGTGSTTDDLARPVERVSYGDITGPTSGFLARLNEFTTTTRSTGLIFRLPTEAEWEYAARAGTTTRFYWFLAESCG